uniref:Uncharacterized protein n=2 Tax=Cacopsylla melanoneura TaxID=428564 RepID=A0A8D9B0N1_9HEMI
MRVGHLRQPRNLCTDYDTNHPSTPLPQGIWMLPDPGKRMSLTGPPVIGPRWVGRPGPYTATTTSIFPANPSPSPPLPATNTPLSHTTHRVTSRWEVWVTKPIVQISAVGNPMYQTALSTISTTTITIITVTTMAALVNCLSRAPTPDPWATPPPIRITYNVLCPICRVR